MKREIYINNLKCDYGVWKTGFKKVSGFDTIEEAMEERKEKINEFLKLASDINEENTIKDMVEEFNTLCGKYSQEDIDVVALKKSVNETIDNWSG